MDGEQRANEGGSAAKLPPRKTSDGQTVPPDIDAVTRWHQARVRAAREAVKQSEEKE